MLAKRESLITEAGYELKDVETKQPTLFKI